MIFTHSRNRSSWTMISMTNQSTLVTDVTHLMIFWSLWNYTQSFADVHSVKRRNPYLWNISNHSQTSSVNETLYGIFRHSSQQNCNIIITRRIYSKVFLLEHRLSKLLNLSKSQWKNLQSTRMIHIPILFLIVCPSWNSHPVLWSDHKTISYRSRET